MHQTTLNYTQLLHTKLYKTMYNALNYIKLNV